MEQTAEGTNQVTEIEPPDLDNLEPWLDKNVTQHFRGFEDKKHPNGAAYTVSELIEESKQQLRMVASGFKEMGFTDEEIKKELVTAVTPYTKAESISEHK